MRIIFLSLPIDPLRDRTGKAVLDSCSKSGAAGSSGQDVVAWMCPENARIHGELAIQERLRISLKTAVDAR